ncbi:hypothetical protein QRX60_42550 [Amycolatopsis mongoliensis]|uniref:Mycothiol-dependent maleylpyruvate isomerase metal-binding domain-containing protein n=1 Tax=Amycolatopsis mongoliensis TaxID=715475 RepID=A0A9Y2JNU2_9PSEU|nr:maleylpyruvate isomerase N-terminal domain-containing protein [Amycolatopsis sp. 4-36]WIY00672.1 hypothetical protein QRX60_42550 [Amycolatopsis sp. 4-36]
MSFTAADVESSVRTTTATLAEARDADWDAQAGPMDWTCWETVEHIADNFFFHAAQLGPRAAATDRSVPFAWARHRPGGPGLVLFADRAAGPDGLLRVVEACGALLVAVVRTTPSGLLAYHDEGVFDAAGFAAITVGETLVHMHDVAGGLGFPWTPEADLCGRLLARFFPGAPADTDPWATLLWATGRGDLPGHPRVVDWRWGAQPSG